MKEKLLKLAKALMRFSEIATDNGVLTINDDLAVGIEVFIEGEGGDYIPAPDGEYTTSDQKIVVKDGKVEEINKIEEQPVKEEETALEEVVNEVDEKDLKIEELTGLLKDRDAVIAELTAKIKELEDKLNKPVEEPIEMKAQVDEKAEKIKQNPALRYFED